MSISSCGCLSLFQKEKEARPRNGQTSGGPLLPGIALGACFWKGEKNIPFYDFSFTRVDLKELQRVLLLFAMPTFRPADVLPHRETHLPAYELVGVLGVLVGLPAPEEAAAACCACCAAAAAAAMAEAAAGDGSPWRPGCAWWGAPGGGNGGRPPPAAMKFRACGEDKN